MKMPRLVLSRNAKLMLRYACAAFPSREVQGFGTIEPDEAGELWVTDIFIPKQEVTGSSVDLKPEDLEKVMLELAEKGQTLSQWPLWWHSHGSMSVGPSLTDANTLQMLAVEYGGVALGLVTNKSSDYHAWWAGTFTSNLGAFPLSGKLDVLHEMDEDEVLHDRVKAMMKENVKEHTYALPAGALGGHNIGRPGYGYWLHGAWVSTASRPFGTHGARLHTKECADVPGACISPELCAAARQAMPGLSKRERKRMEKEEREHLTKYYKTMQLQYPEGSMQRKMSQNEFEEWLDNADADDLPASVYAGGMDSMMEMFDGTDI